MRRTWQRYETTRDYIESWHEFIFLSRTPRHPTTRPRYKIQSRDIQTAIEITQEIAFEFPNPESEEICLAYWQPTYLYPDIKAFVIHGTNTLASIARFRPEKRD
jgi:hypothetical protein